MCDVLTEACQIATGSFADLADDMACAEAYLKHCVRYIMEVGPVFLESFTWVQSSS
jgi:hypothetical protein